MDGPESPALPATPRRSRRRALGTLRRFAQPPGRADDRLAAPAGRAAPHRRVRGLRRGGVLLRHRRPQQVEQAAAGDTAAGLPRLPAVLSTQLSGAQVGITITNLAIGYLAEPAISDLIDGSSWPPGSPRTR